MTAVAAETRGVGRAAPERRLRVLFALPGLHRVVRGAEVAFESVASALARRPECEVTLIGSGKARPGQPYEFRHASCTPRERFTRWPRVPVLRDHYAYEDATFAPRLWRAYRPDEFDVTVACGYPFTNWVMRSHGGRARPAHVFVTQNGDWPARTRKSEYRLFSCDGLVCTNPEYYETNRARWKSALIPNGVDVTRIAPGPAERSRFGLPEDAPVVLIVSALIPSKRVEEGIRAVAPMGGAVHLLVLGDGELRGQVDALGRQLMGERYRRCTVPYEDIPAVYRSADVLLHMSQDEPFGNVYIEAMATGLPVVAHDRPTTRWMLEDRAVLVDTDDLGAVAAGVVAALADRSAEAAAARRELVQRRFAWSAIAGHYDSFLREVVAGRSAR